MTDYNQRPEGTRTLTDLATIITLLGNEHRIRIIDILRQYSRPMTIRELADEMGLKPANLYYHIDRLEENGLILKCDSVRPNGKSANTYMVAAERFELHPDALHGTADGFMRMGHFIVELVRRELRDTVESGRANPGEDGEQPYHIGRHLFKLDAAKLARIKKLLHEIHDIASDQSDLTGPADWFSLTHFLLPRESPLSDEADFGGRDADDDSPHE